MNKYIIAIPSYKRATICNEKTLKILNDAGISKHCIHVYVANEEEYVKYMKTLDPCLYSTIRVGVVGLVHQRNFIESQWPEGQPIVFIDDDISAIDLSLSKYDTLPEFIDGAFDECYRQQSFIWSIYPTFNPYFREPSRQRNREFSTELKFMIGSFYGIINRPELTELQLTLTADNSEKEDTERTILYFKKDGIVLRYNLIGIKTKFFGKDGGGMGTLKDRIQFGKNASIKIVEEYPEYGKIKIRKNGVWEIVLKKIKSEVFRCFESKMACVNFIFRG